MYSFFAFTFKVCKKCYYDPKKFFLEKYQFYADFKFVDAGFQTCSFKNQKQKTKILQIRIVFWLQLFLGAFV